MLLTIIITGLIISAVNFITLALVSRRFSQEKKVLVGQIRQYFESQAGEPSEFSRLVDIISDRFSFKVAQSLKAIFMGTQSVDSKNAKRLDSALVTDLITQQSPMFGAIAGSFPAVGKLLSKNPNLIPMLQGLFAKKDGSAAEDNGKEISRALEY